jgi:hypothetical protein
MRITFSTKSPTFDNGKKEIILGGENNIIHAIHAYSVFGIYFNLVFLDNPWGYDDVILPFARIQELIRCINIQYQ